MEYKDTYGTWIVTTEGDVEGRTIRNLGAFTGHIDEIALYLADKCYYSLKFKLAESVSEYKPTSDSVNISLDYTSNFSNDQRLNHFKNLFKDRDVNIIDGNYYNSVKIQSEKSKEEIEKEKKKKALSKLSEEDKKILGLI